MGLSVFQPTVHLPPHHNRVTDQTVLLSLFPLLFFLSALQSNKSNTVYVCGHDCVLGPYQSHFNPCLAAGA